jgi:hypothetical protein
MVEEPELSEVELFSSSERAEAQAVAMRQFAAEGVEARRGEDGSLGASTPSLTAWLSRHLPSLKQTGRRTE